MTFVRVHRNLNSGPNWVVTRRGKVVERINKLSLLVNRIVVSDRTIVRCRTPKGELSKLGTIGIGRRTVCCWFEGELLESKEKVDGLEISFNPMKDWIPYVWDLDEKRYFDMDAEGFVVNFDGALAMLEHSNIEDILC